MGMLQQLIAALRQQPPQLGGQAGQAQQAMADRPYQMHVQEARALGQQPMTPEQFAQSRQ